MKGWPVPGSTESVRRAPHRITWFLGENLLFALAVLLLSSVSTLFTYSSHGPPLMFIPSGMAFAFILVRGDDRWPGLLIGLMANSYLFGNGLLSTLPTILLSDLGITLSVLIGVRVVKRYGSRNNPFSNLRTLPPMLLAALLVVPALSTVSQILMVYIESGSIDDLTFTLASHFFGYSIGTTLFMPLFISLDLYWKKLDSNVDPFVSVPLFLLVTLISILMFHEFAVSNAEVALVLAVIIMPLLLLTVNYAGLFGGTMSIFLVAVGMVNSYSEMANSSVSMEFWSTIALQMYLILLVLVVCIYYSVLRESKDNVMELNHRVRNNLLLAISLVKLQAGPGRDHPSGVLDDVENRLIVMSTVCDAQHEHGYGTANFAKIMDALQPRMGDWPEISGSGWEVDLEIDRANLAALIVNEVAQGAYRHDQCRRMRIDLLRQGSDIIMNIDLNRERPIRSLADQDLMLLRQVLMRHPRTKISMRGCQLSITLPEAEDATSNSRSGGSS